MIPMQKSQRASPFFVPAVTEGRVGQAMTEGEQSVRLLRVVVDESGQKDRGGRSCCFGGLHGILPHPQIQGRNGSERNELCKVCKGGTYEGFVEKPPLSVREISEQLGFATRNYFSAVFQQITGKTPMEFRET